MSIQERLLIVVKTHGLTPSSFADKIGVQRSNVSHVLSGRNKPGLDFLEKTLLAFPRVNALWLITGELKEGGKSIQIQEQSQTNTESKNEPLIDKMKTDLSKSIVTQQVDKQIDKVMVFYKDGTFSTHIPS